MLRTFTTFALTSALCAVAPAHANTIAIGMIDVNLHILQSTKHANVKRIMIADYSGDAGIEPTHGDLVGTNIIEGFMPDDKDDLTLLAASPFRRSLRGGVNAYNLNYDKLREALADFAAAGVKIACVTFVSNEADQAQSIAAYAASLGITLVASLGNGETKTPYPAMLGVKTAPPSNVIAIASSETPFALRHLAQYQFDGQCRFNDPTQAFKHAPAASYATGYACGRLARDFAKKSSQPLPNLQTAR